MTHYLLIGVTDAERAELAKKLKAGKVDEVRERMEALAAQGKAVRG